MGPRVRSMTWHNNLLSLWAGHIPCDPPFVGLSVSMRVNAAAKAIAPTLT
jgi:hypothetical protein